jgi:hypothetical protein
MSSPQPPLPTTLKEHLKSRFGWTMIAFIVLMLFVGSLIVWQIDSTHPTYWCALADNTSTENANGCFKVLIQLVSVKDHVLIGLITILGLSVAGLISVALGLNIRASGPGGTSVDINERRTTVDTDDASVSIPTPPSKDTAENFTLPDKEE